MSGIIRILIWMCAFVSCFTIEAYTKNLVIADSLSHSPLSYASIFNSRGKLIGQSQRNGKMPQFIRSDFPLTIRHLGYRDQIVQTEDSDTIFMQEIATNLPEIIVESGKRKTLHILAYVREYSTLSSFTDTVFTFREKAVDFMIPPDSKSSFKGWRKPRVLASKSYFQFTDDQGTDSVSDACDYHYSWSDWVGILPSVKIPDKLINNNISNDTVYGKYSPTEIWSKSNEKLKVDIDVLADTICRKWVPALSAFFNHDLDFDLFKLHFNYNDIGSHVVTAIDLNAYSYIIESTGRGREMFMFNNNDPTFSVRTYAEVYILDKTYIKVSEAKKWERRQIKADRLEAYMKDIPELSPEISLLIDRVNHIDRNAIRLAVQPDHRLGSFREKRSAGQAILKRLKGMIGL